MGLTCFSCWLINVIHCFFDKFFEVMFILVITGAEKENWWHGGRVVAEDSEGQSRNQLVKKELPKVESQQTY